MDHHLHIKSPETQSKTIANHVAGSKNSDELSADFTDNRYETTVQKKLQKVIADSRQLSRQGALQEMINNSHQVKQLKAYQELANNSHQVKQTTQLHNMVNNLFADRGIQEGSNAQEISQNKPADKVIQLKGPVKLATKMPTLKEGKEGFLGLQELIKEAVKYDDLTDGRPSAQQDFLITWRNNIREWIDKYWHGKFFFKPYSNEIETLVKLVDQEIKIVEKQKERLERYTKDNEGPYKQMTDEGMLWKHKKMKNNKYEIGKEGFEYFKAVSEKNMETLNADKKKISGDWGEAFYDKVCSALNNAVLTHYTTAARAKSMTEMKSKNQLQKDVPDYQHNTTAYDELGLANTGFVFYYLEAPGSPVRDSRFAKDNGQDVEGARISIPITNSGLLDNGWIMLSDFAQREYPVLAGKKNDEAGSYTSWLATREDKKKENGFDNEVRRFKQGLPDEDIMGENGPMGIAMDNGRPQAEREAASVVIPQAYGDANSKMTYPQAPEIAHDEYIYMNILVGKDIIPGLATKTLVEVANISVNNEPMGEKIRSLDTNELMKFILKDLFRPQAMIPNKVSINESQKEIISRSPNASEGTTTTTTTSSSS